jgi:CMP-N-acetylneuraminic acid synthetase
MNVYAFIFARGGSVGLPGKNIKILDGLPLIAYSILMAKRISTVKKVFVSTDSDEIAKISIEFGAEVIQRPAALATHSASEWDAWRHAIDLLRQRGDNFEVFLSLPTTSPLRSLRDVDNCLKALNHDIDVVIAATPAQRNPYFNMITRTKDGVSKLLLGDTQIKNRQEAPEVYDITTVAYVTRPEFIMKHNSIFSGKLHSVIVPRVRAVDIDDHLDFLFAEAIYNRRMHEFES